MFFKWVVAEISFKSVQKVSKTKQFLFLQIGQYGYQKCNNFIVYFNNGIYPMEKMHHGIFWKTNDYEIKSLKRPVFYLNFFACSLSLMYIYGHFLNQHKITHLSMPLFKKKKMLNHNIFTLWLLRGQKVHYRSLPNTLTMSRSEHSL
jgi:hypothetical protein